MHWPLNRNLLLQALVKLPWDKGSFEQFCSVMEETQNEQLNKQVVGKAHDVLSELLLVVDYIYSLVCEFK